MRKSFLFLCHSIALHPKFSTKSWESTILMIIAIKKEKQYTVSDGKYEKKEKPQVNWEAED